MRFVFGCSLGWIILAIFMGFATVARAGCDLNGTGVDVTGALTNADFTAINTAAANGWDITTCDVSAMTEMSYLFKDLVNFNQDIGGWDTSNVTSMNFMFQGATAFNQDIGAWDVSAVQFMSLLFSGATTFNQDIGAWDTSSVLRMEYMFAGATSFNQDISAWNTMNVVRMDHMFQGATAFNQDIGSWQTANLVLIENMFDGATAFNQDLRGWYVKQLPVQTAQFVVPSVFSSDFLPLWGRDPDITPPSFVFAPSDGATGIDAGGNITITASEEIRLIAGEAALSDTTVDALITLKQTDATGADIDFDATITGAVITINPTNDLGHLQQVYVAIDGALIEDTAHYPAAQVAATLTTVDLIPPVITGPDGFGGTTTGAAAAIAVDENQTDVTQVVANEPVTWSLGGADAAKFDIAANGTVTFKTAPDYETPTDRGDGVQNNSYVAVITATDVASNVTTQTLRVDVGQIYFPGQGRSSAVDEDQDGVSNSDESYSADRDGDGIVDARDYDPQGYFYCQADGRILTGGRVSVQGPGTVNMIKDGGDGEYQWFVDAPGTYQMAIDTSAMEFGTIAQSSAGAMTLADFTETPIVIGSTQTGDTGYLGQFNGSDYDPENPTVYYTSFVIAEGDPHVFGNNIPFADCAIKAVSATVTNHGVEPNNDISQNVEFAIVLSRASNMDSTVGYSLAGSATAGVDYVAPTGQVTIAAGATTAMVSITILDDTIAEGPETIVLTLDSVTSDDSAMRLSDNRQATASIAEDLIDRIQQDLTQVLNTDMRGAVDAQQGALSQTSKSALARLRAGRDASLGCAAGSTPVITGAGQAAGQTVDMNAAYSRENYDCVDGKWVTRQGSLYVTKTENGALQYTVGLSGQSEGFVSDKQVTGRFFGTYASRSNPSQVADGAIQGFGVNAGFYGARSYDQGYEFDYYLGGAFGLHRFDLSFPTTGLDILADGRYSYGALMAGAAIGRKATPGKQMVLPRLGYDAVWAKSLNGHVTASQNSLRDTGSVELDEYRKLRFYAELEFTGAVSQGISLTGQARQWTYAITPRVICDKLWPAASYSCGYGESIRILGYDKRSGTATRFDIFAQKIDRQRSIRFSASHHQPVLNGAGAFVTSFGGTQTGELSLGQTLDIKF